MAMAPRNVAQNVVPLPQVRRALRSPSHPFHVRHQPFYIQPFCIAQVLAGDTLKNLRYQSRAVTDPINAPLVGWHLEYYFFYVRLSQINADMAAGEETYIVNMTHTPAAGDRATTVANLYSLANNTSMRWTKLCYDIVCREWFFEDPNWTGTPEANGLYLCQRNGKDVFDSVMAGVPATIGGDFNVDLDADTQIEVSEVEAALDRWRILKQNNLTELTYEEYLIQNGAPVSLLPGQVDYRPELIRFTRQWQYPSNTVEPTTGLASSAVSWSISDRADKDRRFMEPGFVIGVSIARPKVYLREQRASMVQHIVTGAHWHPRQIDGGGLHTFVTLGDTYDTVVHAGDLSFDLKDLLIRGEQFTNVDLTSDALAKSMNAINMSTPAGRYPTAAEVDKFFVTTGGVVRQDGIVDMDILSHLGPDHYPGSQQAP